MRPAIEVAAEIFRSLRVGEVVADDVLQQIAAIIEARDLEAMREAYEDVAAHLEGSARRCLHHADASTEAVRDIKKRADEVCGKKERFDKDEPCQHRLRREGQRCQHGFYMGTTCEFCVLACPECWDACDSSTSFGPRPGGKKEGGT